MSMISPTICPNKCGYSSYRYYQIQEHSETCSKFPCTMWTIGCRFTGTKSQMHDHGRTCIFVRNYWGVLKPNTIVCDCGRFRSPYISLMQDHQLNCSNIKCKYDKCGFRSYKHIMLDHESICSFNPNPHHSTESKLRYTNPSDRNSRYVPAPAYFPASAPPAPPAPEPEPAPEPAPAPPEPAADITDMDLDEIIAKSMAPYIWSPGTLVSVHCFFLFFHSKNWILYGVITQRLSCLPAQKWLQMAWLQMASISARISADILPWSLTNIITISTTSVSDSHAPCGQMAVLISELRLELAGTSYTAFTRKNIGEIKKIQWLLADVVNSGPVLWL